MTITKHFKIAHDEFILASSSRTLQRAALYVQGWKNEDDFPSCLYPIVFLEGFFCDAPDKVLDDAIQVALKCDRFVRSVDNKTPMCNICTKVYWIWWPL